ncbi:sepiapterin reductase [Legionella birminghamensis]|uniref:Sepiapterin reductase n=1 Tax=Legionella birminghamensis TaxID=28083 RepID=A0A378I741_9GAMM|nr:SDR family NAD(P)-dependent oxidoreductase [Legionella birminghamensis]KTC68261.1 sepiapterin reductase [Legionella birminghamensis]STX31028.1 yueD sepiapterin reductase [Legionella birminghamensis]
MYLITGGGTGIGRALALALAERQKDVLIVGRRVEVLASTASLSERISFFQCDVSKEEDRRQLLSHLQTIENLDGLVHNAGVITPIEPIQRITESAWSRFIATNLNAPLFLSQLLYHKLDKGRVLHIGSGAAYFPVAGWSGYCVSKAALAMLTRCWQLEEKGIAFASVMPGIIDTPMQAVIREADHMEDEKQDFFKTLKTEERLLDPMTVALFLTWLLIDIPKDQYVGQEWDIYDSSHHSAWLKPPHTVPHWE